MPLPAVQLEIEAPPVSEIEPEPFDFDESGQMQFSSEYIAWVEAQEALLVTEDDKPVENIFSELQQRLLVQSLYSSWSLPANEDLPTEARAFWSGANLGLFATLPAPKDISPIAPDIFVSLDVERPEYPKVKSYLFWRLGKWPDLVIEIVSNTKGGELSHKKRDYEKMRIPYYVVFDPYQFLGQGALQAFTYQSYKYEPLEPMYFPLLELGLTLWRGIYEKTEETFLRWVDAKGNLLLTGDERAEREAERAEREAGRAERLAAKLRELGIDPEQV